MALPSAPSAENPSFTVQDHENFHKQDIRGCFKSELLEHYVPTEGFASRSECEEAAGRYKQNLTNFSVNVESWSSELWDD